MHTSGNGSQGLSAEPCQASVKMCEKKLPGDSKSAHQNFLWVQSFILIEENIITMIGVRCFLGSKS